MEEWRQFDDGCLRLVTALVSRSLGSPNRLPILLHTFTSLSQQLIVFDFDRDLGSPVPLAVSSTGFTFGMVIKTI